MKHQSVPENSQMLPVGQPFNVAVDTATLQLLSQWKQEDATRSPEEILAAENELAEFKHTMNESRSQSGEPLLFP